MIKFLFSLMAVFALVVGNAQVNCGQAILENQLRLQNPELDRFIYKQDSISAATTNQSASSRAEKIIIPVVFHVLHMNGEENISDAQIHSAIRIMNEDFNALNDEVDDVVAFFENRIGNAEIELRLASKDPQGNPTSGIDRIESSQTFIGTDASKLNQWPRSKYYNIWVTDVIGVGNAAAYAYRPPAAHQNASADGVVSNHRYVGNIGTAYQSGTKTLTHETAHYINLIHTWGSTNVPGCNGNATNPNDPCFGVNNCGFDDAVNDTPNTIGTSNSGCNLTQNTCGTLDNVQNFMDYSNCESMFTEGQVNRMRNALNSATAERNNLWTSGNYTATGVTELSEARYHVLNHTACRGEDVQFFDESRYDAEKWSWELNGPVTLTSDEQHPVFNFGTPGVYDVSLTVTQGEITKTIEDKKAFVVTDTYGAAVPFYEDFETPKTGWITDVNEAYDGFGWRKTSDAGFDDESSYMVKNIGDDSKNPRDLIFGGIDFRSMTSISVSFEVAYERFNSNNADELQLAFSNDCGETWKTILTRGSNELNNGKPNSSNIFTPNDESDWVTMEVNNVPLTWVSQNAMMRFRFTPGGGNHLFIDNINISGNYDDEVYLVYPEDGAEQRNQDVVIDWRAIPEMDAYEYQISSNESFSAVVSSGTLDALGNSSDQSDTEFKNTELENGTKYYWRVRALEGGSPKTWSEVWSFTVAEDGVGVNDTDERDQISVYPNPADQYFSIGIPEPETSNGKAELYNISGVLVDQQEFASKNNEPTTIRFNSSNIASGTYLLRITTSNKTWNKRLIINH